MTKINDGELAPSNTQSNIQWCIDHLENAKLYTPKYTDGKTRFHNEALVHLNVIKRTIALLKETKRPNDPKWPEKQNNKLSVTEDPSISVYIQGRNDGIKECKAAFEEWRKERNDQAP